jgi:ubiquitin carboxyl-terminal hydrolase 8
MEQMILPKESWRIGHLCNTSFRQAAHSVRPDFIARPDAYQQQNDAGEFLIWLLDMVHEALKTPCLDVDEVDTVANFSDQLAINQLCLSLQNGHRFSKNTLNSLIDECDQNLSYLPNHSMTCLTLKLLAASEWALYSKQNRSIVNVFRGQLLEMRWCLNCKRLSASAETFTLLPVPVSGQPGHLIDCFNRFSRTEQLGPQGKMRCICDTESVPGERKALFSDLPVCLNIQLQRFSYNIEAGVVEKDHTPIDFPLYDLDLASFTLESFSQSGPLQHCLYNLYGVCVHLGSHSASCGHYIAYCLCDENGKWYKFDDEYVQETDMVKEKSRTTLQENAYLLFYKRVQSI